MAKIDQCVTIVAARRRCWRRELSSTAILGRELARVGEQLDRMKKIDFTVAEKTVNTPST